MGGETEFDECYNGNILVNAMNIGIAKKNKVFYSIASGIGNPVVYVGSKTGRDGIHGATMASAEFDEDSESKKPTVQVGDPFTEKLLLEACLELMQKKSIVSIQDMGAAGLTSSSIEMASKGDLGIKINLNLIPCRENNMTPYEIMLSESQERMLMVLKKGKEKEAQKIFEKWGLDFAIIGKLTNSKNTEHDLEKNDEKSKCSRKSGLDFRKYTKQIWLAGLGAFSRAEEEGNKLFDSLVQVGEELESKTTEIADQTVEKVSEKARAKVTAGLAKDVEEVKK